ncbi:MAG: O-antigen biosynthesis protein WlbA [Chitinophagaceae bacterium]
MLRFGIIGCGHIAIRHALQISRIGTLVAVCDNIKDKADALAALYNAGAYYIAEELLEKEKQIDIIAVCTPNGLHALHTIQCLQAGFHVVCEKPMAIRVSDCLDMIKAADLSGRKLMIVKQNRFNPPIAAVKKLLDEGRLGKVFAVQVNGFWNRGAGYYKGSWKGTKDLDGGTLFTQFSHFVDLLYWMLGEVKHVQAVMANYAHAGIIEFEDTGMVLLEFVNGVSGTLQYTVNSYKKNMEGSFTLFAEKATLKIGGQYLNELSYQAMEGEGICNLPSGAAANDYGGYSGSMSNHDKVYENVVNVIKNNAHMATSAFEGMKTVEIIERIYRSARYI